MLLASAIPVALFVVLVVRPRQRRPKARGLVYLVVPLTLFATFGPPNYEQSSLLHGLVLIAALVVILAAIAALPTDPRPALAVALILSAPLVIAFTVVRARRLAVPKGCAQRSGMPPD